MHTVHAGLSVIVPLQTGSENIVNDYLRMLNNDHSIHSPLYFADIASVLSASAVVMPAQDYGTDILPASLLFFTTYCGPLKNHLDELVRHGASGLRGLFKHGVNFPPEANTSDEALKKFLLKNNHPDTFYSGIHYLTRADINNEEQLRKAIDDFLYESQQNNTFSHLDCATVRKKIQQHITDQGDKFLWAQKPVRRTFMDFWVLKRPFLLLIILVAVLVLSFFVKQGILRYVKFVAILILLSLGLVALLYRLAEIDMTQRISMETPDDKMRQIDASQHHPVINEMTATGSLKTGWVRRLLLYTVLRLVSAMSGTLYIATITTARWLTADKGKRLVFISNFANRSESYIRDFIDSPQSQKNINLLFGQCDGYPPTRWLRGNGAINNLQGFMNVVQEQQHITQLWYCPYKHLSVDNIINNHKIRKDLFQKLTKKQIKRWLRLL